MSKKLGYTWYPKDFISDPDVMFMTSSERGVYRDLLDLAYLNDNVIRYDISMLAKYTNSDTKTVKKVLEIKGKEIDVGWSIPSCEKRLNLAERNRKNGAKGGRPKTQTETQNKTQNTTQEERQREREREREREIESEEEKERESIELDSAENEFSSTKKNQKTIEEKKEEFKKSIEPFREKYDSEMLNDFWRYWTEKNKNGKKMRFEMQKVFDVGRRLITWSKNENNKFNGTRKQTTVSQSRQERVDEVREFRIANQQALADRLSNYLTGDTK